MPMKQNLTAWFSRGTFQLALKNIRGNLENFCQETMCAMGSIVDDPHPDPQFSPKSGMNLENLTSFSKKCSSDFDQAFLFGRGPNPHNL